MTKPTLKTTTTAKAPVAKTATKATAKAPATTPTRKAPTRKAAPATAPIADGVYHALTARVEALETQSAVNESRIADAFENMTKVIANLQVTLAHLQAAPATRTRETAPATAKAPAKTAAPARDNSERGTYEGPAIDGPVDAVLAFLADCVITNAEAGFLNENVAKASPNSYRRYLRTAQNKAFKACREAHDLTLTQMDDSFAALFS